MKKTEPTANALPFEAARPEETLPLLQSAVPRNSRLQCWTPGRKFSYTSRVVKVSVTGSLIWIAVSKEFPGGDEFENDLRRESPGEILFSLHLPTDVVFFKGELREGEGGLFNARIREPLYKVQRRESLRLPVPGKPVVELLTAQGGKFSAEVVNISEGGIAIAFRRKFDFEVVSALTDPVSITFTAFGIATTAKASVRHGSEIGSALSGKSYRLGLSFTEIDAKVRTQLSQLVFEESAKYLGRF